MGRFRQVLVYDRFLARVFQHLGDRAVAKGGVVIELRLERARTTRDLDIHLRGPSDGLLAELRSAAPPSSWEPMYERMAREDELPWRTIAELLVAVRAFIDPALSGVTGT